MASSSPPLLAMPTPVAAPAPLPTVVRPTTAPLLTDTTAAVAAEPEKHIPEEDSPEKNDPKKDTPEKDNPEKNSPEKDALAWPHSTQATLHPAHAAFGYNGAHDPERRTRSRDGRSSSRPKKRKRWSKLLWVKQDYPDNWVDPTFLNELQRNINVHPYDFYSLVADSTVVVQHLCTVVIFVTSFITIYKEQVSPVNVVTTSTILTVIGWALWDRGWERREPAPAFFGDIQSNGPAGWDSSGDQYRSERRGSGLAESPGTATTFTMQKTSPGSYFPVYSPTHAPTPRESPTRPPTRPPTQPPTRPPTPPIEPLDYAGSHRRQQILNTAKSALLIYFTLLGLSPILRSLTTSITSDSIWAISTWLFIANCLSADYGSGSGSGVASFSTNAAITSSVVLASRLPTTTHVFSLILFSIQVFGLFPVFRRYVKNVSWSLHVCLTVGLVVGAAAGLAVVVGWGWAVVWVFGVLAGMGGCGWWMIDLQKYKNEIHGPWDIQQPRLNRTMHAYPD